MIVVIGHPLMDVCSTVAAVASEQFFFSKQAIGEQCPSSGYVTLEAQPGQKVKVNVIRLDNDNDHQEFGGVVEDGIEHAYEISTNTDGRLEGQYTSKRHSITLVIEEAQHSHIIVFQGKALMHINYQKRAAMIVSQVPVVLTSSHHIIQSLNGMETIWL
jgi:hypothetical protein